MPSRPLLELDHSAIVSSWRSLCRVPDDTAFCEELDKTVHPPHGLGGDAQRSAIAASTTMLSEKIDYGIIDVRDLDFGLRKPLSEVAGRVSIVIRRTARVTQPQ